MITDLETKRETNTALSVLLPCQEVRWLKWVYKSGWVHLTEAYFLYLNFFFLKIHGECFSTCRRVHLLGCENPTHVNIELNVRLNICILVCRKLWEWLQVMLKDGAENCGLKNVIMMRRHLKETALLQRTRGLIMRFEPFTWMCIQLGVCEVCTSAQPWPDV